jgi:hypothetical protein
MLSDEGDAREALVPPLQGAAARAPRSASKDKKTRWRVTDNDWEHFALYDRFRKISERVLRHSLGGHAPVARHRRPRRSLPVLTAGGLVLARCVPAATRRPPGEARGRRPGRRSSPMWPSRAEGAARPQGRDRARPARPTCSALDLTKTRVSTRTTTRPPRGAPGALNLLTRDKKFARTGVVAVFEGVDAAGKGGAIRRVTSALDARLYRVHPVAAPTEEERASPTSGASGATCRRAARSRSSIAPGTAACSSSASRASAATRDWQRAYGEINDFEEQLVEPRTVVVKFWLQISTRPSS